MNQDKVKNQDEVVNYIRHISPKWILMFNASFKLFVSQYFILSYISFGFYLMLSSDEQITNEHSTLRRKKVMLISLIKMANQPCL